MTREQRNETFHQILAKLPPEERRFVLRVCEEERQEALFELQRRWEAWAAVVERVRRRSDRRDLVDKVEDFVFGEGG